MESTKRAVKKNRQKRRRHPSQGRHTKKRETQSSVGAGRSGGPGKACAMRLLPPQWRALLLLAACTAVALGATISVDGGPQASLQVTAPSSTDPSSNYLILRTSSSTSNIETLTSFDFSPVATGFCASAATVRIKYQTVCLAGLILCLSWSNDPTGGTASSFRLDAIRSTSWCVVTGHLSSS